VVTRTTMSYILTVLHRKNLFMH